MKTLALLNQKFVEMIQSKTFPQIALFFVKIICAILLALALIFPNMLIEIFNRSNYLLFKVIFSFFVFFQLENLIKLYDFLKNRIEIRFWNENTEKTETFEGLDIYELSRYIIENRTFKGEDVKKHFAITKDEYLSIAGKLDELGIFERGEKNQRILKKNYKITDILSLLKIGFIKVNNNQYTTTPA